MYAKFLEVVIYRSVYSLSHKRQFNGYSLDTKARGLQNTFEVGGGGGGGGASKQLLIATPTKVDILHTHCYN